MTVDKAKVLLKQLVAQKKKWGKQFAPPVTLDTFFEALAAVSDAGYLDVDAAQVTKLRRQLAAANARAVRRSKDTGGEDSSELE